MSAAGIPELTAHRIYKGKAAYVVVMMDGAELDRLGGKRAERAQAAIVSLWPARTHGLTGETITPTPGVSGLRADFAKAEQEAHRMVTNTHMRTRGRFGAQGSLIPLNRPTWAVAVPVQDEAL